MMVSSLKWKKGTDTENNIEMMQIKACDKQQS